MSHLNTNTLWDYAHAMLDADDVATVTAHLQNCASCQAQLDDIRGAQSLLSQLPEPPPMPDLVARRVGAALTEKLDAREARRLTSWWPMTLSPRWVLVGAAAAAALAFAVVSLRGPSMPVPNQPAPLVAKNDTPPAPAVAPAPTVETPKPAAKPLTVRVARAKRAHSGAGALAKAQVLDQGAKVTTKKGGSLWLDLPDGTKAGLMGQSEVALSTVTAKQLTLDVAKGDLAMVVPHREDRQLTVRAGDVEVLDLGTRFLVSRELDRVLVAVSEGSVEVRTPGTTRTVKAGRAVEWSDGSLTERAWESAVKPAAAPTPITSNARLGDDDDFVEVPQTPDIPENAAQKPPAAPAQDTPPAGTPDDAWAGYQPSPAPQEQPPPDELAPPVPPEGLAPVPPLPREDNMVRVRIGDFQLQFRMAKRSFRQPFAPIGSSMREEQVRQMERMADDGDCEGALSLAESWLAATPTDDAREGRLRYRALRQKMRCLKQLGRDGEAADVARELQPR